MKKIIFELLFFCFWCFVFMILIFKLIQGCEKNYRNTQSNSDSKKAEIQVNSKKYKFEKVKDWFEDKSISQRKLETIDRIYEFEPTY